MGFDQYTETAAPAESVFWCMNYTYEAFLAVIATFHGHVAPGLVMGGKMTDMAVKALPDGILYDAISETGNCLPDAIQILTPCTIGNGWLKVVPFGKFAISLYDKTNGMGIRVCADLKKMEKWPELYAWFCGHKSKKEQHKNRLMEEIKNAGDTIFSMERVEVLPEVYRKQGLGKKSICSICGESYPEKHGPLCRGCQGDGPYGAGTMPEEERPLSPDIRVVPLEEARGKRVLHDMTEIIPQKSKGPVFRKGHRISGVDLCRLQQMGRMHLFVEEESFGPEWVHENDVARAFAKRMAGKCVRHDKEPREGKINFQAEKDGILVVDVGRLEKINLVPGVICASRKTFSHVTKGRNLAGTRAIPLFLHVKAYHQALAVLDAGPLFAVHPLKNADAGILITGNEVFLGLVKDQFEVIIRAKVEAIGSRVVAARIVPDEREAIREGVEYLLDAGADLIITTAGLSVDPDDVTREGLMDAGLQDILYGAPVLPGAMSLLGRIGNTPVMGVPACALYFKTTAFDILFPRVLAGIPVTRKDLAALGHGAFCLECKTCRFPKCSFGK